MPDPLKLALNLPFQEQIDFFRAKLNLPTERWDDIWKGAHDRAFVVAGAMKADLLDDLRQAVSPLQRGTLDAFRKDFKRIVAQHGWTGWTGEGSKGGEAWRTKVIYETNVRTSHAAGRYRQLTDPDSLAAMPYWRYVHNDSVMHPRPQHLAWNGLTLRHDHPFWQTHFAPNGWGCRCTIVAQSQPGSGDKATPPDGWNAIDAKTGEQPGIDKGWGYAPGANAVTPLRELIDQKLIKLDAPIGAAMWQELKPALAMERELEWWKTLDELSADPHARGKSFVVGALSPETVNWLSINGKPQPISAEVAVLDNLPKGVKQLRHEADQNGLTMEEWRALPALLDKPGAIYYDTGSGNLVYVADGVGPNKAAVEFVGKAVKRNGVNQITTAFRVDDKTIAGAVKGGKWLPVEVSGRRVGVEPT
jgi:hypothetical protein